MNKCDQDDDDRTMVGQRRWESFFFLVQFKEGLS